MDFDNYLGLRWLCQSKWDPMVLWVLAKGPCRYMAMVRWLRRLSGEHIADSNVTRTLTRLQEAGLVRAQGVVEGRREYAVYHVTDQGREELEVYRDVVFAYARARARPPDVSHYRCRTYTRARSEDPVDCGTKKPQPMRAREGR